MHTCMLAHSIFDSPVTKSAFNIEHFDRNLFTCSCEEREGINDFKFGTFIGHFPSDGSKHGKQQQQQQQQQTNKKKNKKKKKKENSGNKASCPRAYCLGEIHPSASLTVVRELTELEPKTTQCTFTSEVHFTRLNRKRTPYKNWDYTFYCSCV